jgi:choline-glycine betaine transporter
MAGTKIERAQQKLMKLFMNGEGAHSDTLPAGNTILHVSFFPWTKSGWTVFYLVGPYVDFHFFSDK